MAMAWRAGPQAALTVAMARRAPGCSDSGYGMEGWASGHTDSDHGTGTLRSH